MKKSKDIVLMAVSSGRESSEGSSIKRYIGVASCTVVGINPNKAELEKLLSTPNHSVSLEKEPEYISEDEAGIRSIRVDIYLKTVPEKCNGIDTILKVGYFIKDQKRFNGEKTKVQVINVYGDTTWLTKEQLQTKTLPENMSFFNMTGMRPAMTGEEDITNFIKKLLNIPRYSVKKKDGTTAIIENPKLAECQLDNIAQYFTGNISELKSAINLRRDNKVKMAFGVKTTPDNKLYQDCFKEYPLNNAVTDYSYLAKAIQERQKSSGYPNTFFGGAPFIFTEWTPEQSNLGGIASSTSAAPATPIQDDWASSPVLDDDFPA